MQSAKLKEVARQIRRDIIIMSGRANASHSGSALSAVETLVALYFDVMRIDPRRPDWALRDRFLLSKGHAGAVLYATLAERGFFSKKKLDQFCLGANLTTHPTRFSAPGVEVATGSLGHGLPMGVGMALAARMDRKAWRTYVLLSDGECDEGSVWESILFAGFHKLDNLTVIIDYNKIQSFGRTADVLDLEPLKQKFESFRWNVSEVDGHDFEEIRDALGKAKKTQGKPQCIIAHTVKGKGVSYMEDKLEWHYRSPTGELGEQALKELRD